MVNNSLRQSILFSVGFRPFFLAASGYGALALGAWTGWLGELWALPEVYPTGALHGHEMMFGFALAAVAGFLLTAVPQWTSSSPTRSVALAALAGAWLIGRLAMLGAGTIGPIGAMALDLLFPLGLCLAIGAKLVKAQNRHNYGFIVLLGLAALANFCWHMEMAGFTNELEGVFVDELSGTALELMLNLLLIIVAIMGGRVIPMFSANWMRHQGEVLPIVHPEWLKRSSIIGLILVAGAEFLSPILDERYTGILAMLAGLAYLIRLRGWNGYRTYAHPLVWILHLAYFWLCLALFLKGGQYLGAVPEAAARHAAAVGAVGTMIMAIMPRVSLGHSGRDLILPRPMLAAYALFVLTPVLRVASPFLNDDLSQIALTASGLCWTGAFAIFLATFAPILLSPRVDQK